MKKTLITSTAFLLTGTILLGGCSKGGNGYAPGAEKDPSSVSSESSVSEVLSESRSVNSSSGVESSSEQSSDVSAAPVPVEFTDEDRELQKLLGEMGKNEYIIRSWFMGTYPIPKSDDVTQPHDPVRFKFSQNGLNGDHTYYQIPPDYSENGMLIPRTYDEMKELMLNNFSEGLTEKLMNSYFGNGYITEVSENVYSVILDTDASFYPRFIETKGALYRSDGEGGIGFREIDWIEYDTVKITRKTDDTIVFSYLRDDWKIKEENKKCLTDERRYNECALTGRLKYERGGWKRDWDKADKERRDEWQEELLREQNSTAEQGSGESS